MRNKIHIVIICLFVYLLASCTPAAQTPSSPVVVTVDASAAAQPWLTELYACANQHSIVLRFSSQAPDIYLRVGEPEVLVSPAYKIDDEEILIVTSRESPLQNLTHEQAQALFMGQGDLSLQVWVYAADADVQVLFDRLVMNGRSVTSYARLATSPQQVSDVLNGESNAVGVLPRHWKTGNTREVYTAGAVPVLAITKAGPGGATRELLACMQN